jgi:hypothetical protein
VFRVEAFTLVAMNESGSARSVTRLFPFVLRARALLIGRDTLWRSRKRLQFVLITEDISENSRAEILHDFAPYPVVQCFTAEDLEKHFAIRGAKVIGFAKSTLASSIYAELKEYRLNKPAPSREAAGPLEMNPEPPSAPPDTGSEL